VSLTTASIDRFAKFVPANANGYAVLHTLFQKRVVNINTHCDLVVKAFDVSEQLAKFITILVLEDLHKSALDAGQYQALGLATSDSEGHSALARMLCFNPAFLAFFRLYHDLVPLSVIPLVRSILDPEVRKELGSWLVVNHIQVGLGIKFDLALYLIKNYDDEKKALDEEYWD
jgi:hypothetical protein